MTLKQLRAHRYLSGVLALLAACSLLSACTPGDGGEASDSDSDSVSATETGGSNSNQAARMDYFNADLDAMASLPASVYASGIHVTLAQDLLVDHEDVTAYIHKLQYNYRRAMGDQVHVTNQPLNWGDDAYVYYTGYVDGKAFSGGSNASAATPSKLGLGSGLFIPGFEAGLIGVTPADTSEGKPVEVHATFPSTYSTASLAGKQVVFKVWVVYADRYTVPHYDASFILDTLMFDPAEGTDPADEAAVTAEFEAYVADYLTEQSEPAVTKAAYNAMWDVLTEAATFHTLPKEELDYYYDNFYQQIQSYYNYYASTESSVGDFDSFARKFTDVGDEGDWEAELRRAATRSVQRDILTYLIAQQEGVLSVSDLEFQNMVSYWIQYYADNYQTTVSSEEVRANLGDDFIRRSAFSDKMEAYLKKKIVNHFEGDPSDANAESET